MDNKIFFENLNYLAKSKGIRLGDLEKACSVSPGYFSRIGNSEDQTKMPNLYCITRVAEKLNVSIDSLVLNNYASLNETELFIVKMIEKIIKRTQSGALQWDRKFKGDAEREGMMGDHPLLESVEGVEAPIYKTKIIDKCCMLDDDIYSYLDKKTGRTFYISKARYVDSSLDKKNCIIFELNSIISYGYDPELVCYSKVDSPEIIKEAMRNLFESAKASSKHLKLDENIKTSLYSLADEPDPELEKIFEKKGGKK